MRVLQIIYSLTSGGAERFVVDLSNELIEQGQQVSLCVLRDDSLEGYDFYKGELSASINYINLSIPAGFKISNSLLLYKVIRHLNPDIVHCHLNLVNYIFPLTYLFPHIAFFHTIHSHSRREAHNKLEYHIRRFFYKRERVKAISISAESSKSFVLCYHILKYNEIINGRSKPILTDKIDSVEKEIRKINKEKGLVLLHVARCSIEKNQIMLISVFNRIIKEGYKCVLLIIGDGFHSEQADSLRELACDKIHFLGARNNVADYFYSSDAFCLSSSYEGMPITLIEAMACGCIPICTPVGGIVNIIKDRLSGYVSKTIDEEDYYKSVRDYLDNPGEVDTHKLKEYYQDNLTIQSCASNHLKLYKQSL